jgi:hypothetical protein
MEGPKSGKVSETCRKHEIGPARFSTVGKTRWGKVLWLRLGGSAATLADEEQAKRIKQLERALEQSHLQIEILTRRSRNQTGHELLCLDGIDAADRTTR